MSKIALTPNISGTGTFTIASPGTSTDRTLTLPDTSGTVMTDSGTQTANFSALTVNSNNISATNSLGFRNRIINGDMRIDQRNAGAALTVNALAAFFAVDRWYGFGQAADGVYTLQQDSAAPSGFTNSLRATVTTVDASISATNIYGIQQRIEGFNISDLGWGTANAQPVTVSFWVRSSVTGSFGARLANGGTNRSYPFSYTINAANTWERKSATIPGDTSGTWLTTNGIGISLVFMIGAGSTFTGTANTWAAADLLGPTGSVQLISTLGATLFITGVQLEAGSTATPFERRAYGTELQLCQRYFEVLPAWYDTRNIVNTSNGYPFNTQLQFKVTKRANPTMVASIANTSFSALAFGVINVEGCVFGAATGSTGASATSYIYADRFTASIEL